jgi:hypothetical protein
MMAVPPRPLLVDKLTTALAISKAALALMMT